MQALSQLSYGPVIVCSSCLAPPACWPVYRMACMAWSAGNKSTTPDGKGWQTTVHSEQGVDGRRVLFLGLQSNVLLVNYDDKQVDDKDIVGILKNGDVIRMKYLLI